MTNFRPPKKLAQLLASLYLVLLITGCGSQPIHERASCAQSDWYELGRRDGSHGASTDRLSAHKNRCKDDFKPEWETMYLNGRNAALVEFCEPKNGYELGRTGQPYLFVCPSMTEQDFISAYRKGQRAYELQKESSKLNARIDQLAERLLATNDQSKQEDIASQLDQLKKNHSETKKELNESISN